MTVRPPLPALLVCLLLGVLSLGAAACGDEERTGLLSQKRATDLKAGLADVDEAVRDGSCTRVREELDGLENQLSELPQRTDAELRERLEEGVRHLEEIAPQECEEQTETTETEPETTPDTTTETVPTEPVPTETVPPEPVPTEPPAQTQPPAEELPGNGNGNGNNGNGNGNGGEDDDLTGQGGAVAPE